MLRDTKDKTRNFTIKFNGNYKRKENRTREKQHLKEWNLRISYSDQWLKKKPFYIFMCVPVSGGAHTTSLCGSQRRACRNYSSPTVLELSEQRFCGMFVYLLSHLANTHIYCNSQNWETYVSSWEFLKIYIPRHTQGYNCTPWKK